MAFAMALLLVGCGSEPTAGPPGPTVPSAGRGWLGGEPEWQGGVAGGDGAASGAAADMAATEAMAGPGVDDSVEPMPPVEGGLRAGSVDDNAEFDDYLGYLDRLRDLGIELRDVDPTGRIVATVVGSNDRPVAGVAISVRQGGEELATVRTTADGTARVLPKLYGGSADDAVELVAEDVAVSAAPGTDVTIDVDRPGGVDGPAAVDVLFLLDATGSMGDEIDRLKASIDSVSARIDALESQPDVRFAMTLYRDEGDAFVTASYDFTSDVAAFRKALADVVADGGGDYPEAMEEGLAEALAEPAWRDPASTVQLAFLVADAPPQIGRNVPTTYADSIRDATARGIKVFPVASSESDDQAEGAFRQVAQATGARFVFLSYGAGGAATGGNTDITSADYEELSLDDLVVRLVTEELDHLGDGTGPTPTSTTPQSTTTTNPPGQ
ncbi:MAG: VWA domain-containing protein [Actinobacteria bacterium]|nr:VWA domain-containing protein [Actinomycetota bacterium]